MKIKTNDIISGAVTMTRETIIDVTRCCKSGETGLGTGARVTLTKNGKHRATTWNWFGTVSIASNGVTVKPMRKAGRKIPTTKLMELHGK